MKDEVKKSEWVYGIFLSILILGPFVAGPILFVKHRVLAGILSFVIPWGLLFLIAFLRKRRAKKNFYKIPNASTRFDIIPVEDGETIRALYDNSALTWMGEPSDPQLLHFLYNWLNAEGVLKEERLNMYTFDGALLKEVYGKRRRFGDDEKYMSIFLRDLNLNDSNTKQFSLDRMQIGGRWLDDIVDNS